MSHPPALYDTSISSGTESQSQSVSVSHSWSTGSAGRQKQQQQQQPHQPQPSHFFPKPRPQQQQQQQQSPSNASSRYPSWAIHSPVNSHSNSHSHSHSQSPSSRRRRTLSEPGVPEQQQQLRDQDSFLSHIHRFSAMEQKYASSDINVNVRPSTISPTLGGPSTISPSLGPYQGGTGTLKYRTATTTNANMQRYPDPEPQMDMDESVASEEQEQQQQQQQRASPHSNSNRLSRYEQYTRSMESTGNHRNRSNKATRSTPPSTSSQPPPSQRKDTLSLSSPLSFQQQQHPPPPESRGRSRQSLDSQQPPPQRQSFDSNHNIRGQSLPARKINASPTNITTVEYESSSSIATPTTPIATGIATATDIAIETPSPARVQHIKRQLWDEKESLQVAHPPTHSYADYATYSERRASNGNASASGSGNGNGNASVNGNGNASGNGKGNASGNGKGNASGNAYPPPETSTVRQGQSSRSTTRSLSPRKQESALPPPSVVPKTPSTPRPLEEDQKFKSKFYQAALQARLQKTSSLPLPPEITSCRSMPFSEQHNAAATATAATARPPFHEEQEPVVAAKDSKRHLYGPSRSVSISTTSDAASKRNTSYSTNSNSNSNSYSNNNSTTATVVVTNPAPTTPRSWADPSKPPRGREASVERRGREPLPYVERRGKESSSVERRGKEQSESVKRTTRESSTTVEAPKRADTASYWQHKVSPNNTTTTTATDTATPRTTTATTEESPAAVVPQSFHGSAASYSSGKVAERNTMQVENYDSNTNPTSLMDKLKAIKRDNPAEALAQIDAILRQESRSMSGDPDSPRRRTSTDTRDKEATLAATNENIDHAEEEEEEEEEETDSDDETSVSSITNPTYLSVRQDQDQAQAQIHGQNPFADTNPFSNTFGQQQPASTNTNPFATTNPSTAAFRRPRPSALRSYTASPSQDIPTVPVPQKESRSKEKKRMLKEFPPPVTIKVKDTPYKQQAPSPIHARPPSPINAGADVNSTNQFEQDTPKVAATPVKKLDKFMANSTELAEKIRVWDEMSNGLQKSMSGDSAKDKEEKKTDDMLPHRLPTPPPVSSRRPHPWDTSIPVVHERLNPRDTSMEQGIGVEMEIQSRNPNPFDSFEQSFENTPVESSQQRGQFRRTNSTPIPCSNANPFETFDSEPKLFASDSVTGGWDVKSQFTPERQENTQKISDAFDQAWVSLPASSLFPEPTTQHRTFEEAPRTTPVNTTPPRHPAPPVEASQRIPTTPRSLQLPKQQPQDLHQSIDLGGIEVSLVEDDPYQQETHNDGKEKQRRGFFRAFKRKDTKTKKDSSALAGCSASGDGTQSLSTPPRQQAQPQQQLPILDSPQLDAKEMDPPRGRRGSRTPTRGAGNNSPSRSNSLERFRSASMAHKFSRVMRLYDRD